MNLSPADGLSFAVVPENEMTDDLDRAIRNILVACFLKDADHFSNQRWWHSPHQWSVLALTGDGGIVGVLCVVERTVTVGGSGLTVAGIGNVCTLPEWRGMGIADAVMATALAEAGKRSLDAGLLFCKPALEKVYARMGWKTVDGAVYMEDADGGMTTLPAENIAMSIPVAIEAFPAGDIDLRGRDW